MFIRLAGPVLALSIAAFPLNAQTAPATDPVIDPQSEVATVDALFAALALPDLIDIMREEGLEYGRQINTDLFPGQGGAEWHATIATIYDSDRMQDEVRDALGQALSGEDVAPMLDFFQTEPGQSFVALEVSARRALLDEAVEEASKEIAAIEIADETPRYQIMTRFIEANDLIETNVVGAMNSNFAFYRGLLQGDALPGDLTETEILADVWAQEPEIRTNTTEWVYSFLLMAYEPLTDADIEAYIAFSQTGPGQSLNRAIFEAFDGVFEDVSERLGFAATRYMVGQAL